MTTNINVRFVSLSPIEIPIKPAMNTIAAAAQNETMATLFHQMAAYSEEIAGKHGLEKFRKVISRYIKPHAEMERVAVRHSCLLQTSPTDEVTSAQPTASKKQAKANRCRLTEKPTDTGKAVHFVLKAPSAKSVKLAADFTNWDRSPLELQLSADGVWSGVIPLKPGKYSYRFIVDGKWCDDPRSTQRVPNPFGTENALLHVG